MAISQGQLTSVLFAAVLCGSCDQQATGSFFDQSADDLAEWSKKNPDVSDRTWASIPTLTCQLSSAQICGAQGCKSAKPATYVRWHPSSKRYERCGGSSPCDSYAANVSYSGAWANIEIPERAMLARLTASGQFLEVLTQMDTVFVYHGQCRPAQ